MKPIQLTIEGLHSFREKQTIHFDLLSDAGVFGIFGPTGSGKSTILDGITLALYGLVGRAKNGTQGILNHAEDSLAVSFQFQIGTADERRTYRVDRRYVKNNELSVRNTYSRLVELDANGESLAVLADKDREVTQQVQAILGLKQDDFSRAVVLPQGKFAEFLHLAGKDRRQMLQRLFSLEQYGIVLNTRLNQRFQDTDQNLREVEAVQLGMGDCSAAALAEAERQLQEVRGKEAEAERALSEARRKFEQSKQIVDWQQQLREIRQRLLEHEALESEIQELIKRIELSERAGKVRPFIDRFEQAQKNEQERLLEREKWQQVLSDLQAAAEQARNEYESAKQMKQTKSPEWIRLQTQLEAAIESEREIQTLREKVNELRRQLERKQAEQAEIDGNIQLLGDKQSAMAADLQQQKGIIEENIVSPEFRAAVQDVLKKADVYARLLEDVAETRMEVEARGEEAAHSRTEWERAKEQLTRLTEQFANMEERRNKLTSHPVASEEWLNKQEVWLTEWKGMADRLLRLEQEHALDTGKLTAMERDIDRWNGDWQSVTDQLLSARERLQSLRQHYQDILQQDRQAMAVKLAADLQKGEACPVCGSQDHPHLASASDVADDASGELEQVQANMLETETEIQQLTDRETNLKANLAAGRVQESSLRESIGKRSEEMASLRSKLGSHLLGMSFDSPSAGDLETDLPDVSETISGEQAISCLAQAKQVLEQQRNQLRVWQEQVRQAEAELGQLKDAHHEAASGLAVQEHQLQNANGEWEKARRLLDTKEQLAKEAERILQNALKELGVETAEQTVRELEEKEKLVRKAQEMRDKLQEILDRNGLELARLQQTASGLRAEITGLATSLSESERDWQEKEVKLKQITNGIPAQELREKVNDELEELTAKEEQTKQIHEQKQTETEEAGRQLLQAETRCTEIAERRALLQQELTQQLQAEHFVTADEVKDAILLAQEEIAMKQRVQEYQETGRRFQAEQSRLEERLDGQNVTEEEWQQIQTGLAIAEQSKQNATLAHGAAHLQYQELRDKHIRWTELENKRAELAKERGYLQQLKDVLRGDRFVEFLAQEQLNFVAIQASDRLKRLTRNRYALEVGEDGGFIMRDDANGGVKRPVSSLSGGETFLTSLALALSLSSQIQLRGKYPLEFFFLDEGFGTLDGELLDVVMSTLEQLHMENMTIGVISHVPELQQRLHRRLVVEPAEAAGRGTRVRMERT